MTCSRSQEASGFNLSSGLQGQEWKKMEATLFLSVNLDLNLSCRASG